MQRVAIAGFGAIGKVVAEHLDRGIDGLSLAAVSARDAARATAAMAGFTRPVPVLPLARLWEEADIVVECAPAKLLPAIAKPFLRAGKSVIVLSVGASLLWFWLLSRGAASRVSAFYFLTPIFGLAFGALFLGEAFGPGDALGLVAVALGIVLVQRA